MLCSLTRGKLVPIVLGMKNTMAAGTVKNSLRACLESARAQGWDGVDGDYEYTREDLDSVVEDLGRRPTSAEWAEAGIDAGSEHTEITKEEHEMKNTTTADTITDEQIEALRAEAEQYNDWATVAGACVALGQDQAAYPEIALRSEDRAVSPWVGSTDVAAARMCLAGIIAEAEALADED